MGLLVMPAQGLPRQSQVCGRCRHHSGSDGQRRCAAFTEIPGAIWAAQDDHTKPWPGDHGLRFSPITGQGKNQ